MITVPISAFAIRVQRRGLRPVSQSPDNTGNDITSQNDEHGTHQASIASIKSLKSSFETLLNISKPRTSERVQWRNQGSKMTAVIKQNQQE